MEESVVTQFVPATLTELLDLLARYDVPVNTWGRGRSKTALELWNEVVRDGVYFEDRGDGALYRVARSVRIFVFCKLDDGRILRLKECQVSMDGTLIDRVLPNHASMSETVMPGEAWIAAALRAAAEELGIHGPDPLEFLVWDEDATDIHTSKAYPGLMTHNAFARVIWKMDPRRYQWFYFSLERTLTAVFYWYETDDAADA